MKHNRFVIKIGGASGQGINSVGEIMAKGLKRTGFNVFAYREYPSLIQGGFATYQLDFSDRDINASSMNWDLAICLSRDAIHNLITNLNKNGILIHSIETTVLSRKEKELIEEKDLKIIKIEAKEVIKEMGGIKILENIFLLNIAWRLLDLNNKVIKQIIKERFIDKKKVLRMNLKCIEEAQNYNLPQGINKFKINFSQDESNKSNLLITGNYAMALGAIAAGVRAYYAYPMTPSSSILTYLAKVAEKTGMLVKQAEDEITAVQMTLGSMHMGTRALVATSGGGFDLMSESFSMAGMAEIPLVCIVAQRPGPATGLPTWTAGGDLNMAVYAGHGEYPRCVYAASDAGSAYLVVQKALNTAEKFQIPVIVLTEKQIAESFYLLNNLPESLEIERGLVVGKEIENIESKDRYKITDTGISPRWLPGQTPNTFYANADEHFEQGRITEDKDESKKIYKKRMKKLQTLKKELPEPEVFGKEQGDILFVGWGSVKATVLDVMNLQNQKNISYLHYECLYPVKTEKFQNIKDNFNKIVLIENNYSGQLGDLIKLGCGHNFENKLLKYDGRPFFIEEILDYIESIND
ncbi:2-oxoacid:acceptor oxidoreductase subunit alpha [Candidatus Dojkabacteria bacterium]|nr:2-oxoacid:acceptor oxidoreductase subunit alpha [Candidatus Dojkabacteria bacterium]